MRKILLLAAFISSFAFSTKGQDTIYRNLTVVQSDSLIQAHPGDTNFVILDVRQAGPFAAGHLEGAINIDYYDPNFSSLIAALDHDKIYLVHCQSGGRSAITFSMMQTQLFREVYNMLGGMNAWVGAGYPVVTSTEIKDYAATKGNSLVFPNPVTEKASICLNDKNIKSGEMAIFNISGQKIKEFNFQSDLIQIDRKGLDSGIYFYMIKTDSHKVVIGDFIVK